MSDEPKTLQETLKKLDLSDIRILLFGIVLLLLPLFFLFARLGVAEKSDFTRYSMETLANRKAVFNFGLPGAAGPSGAGGQATALRDPTLGAVRTTGKGASQVTQQVKDELGEAMRLITRTKKKNTAFAHLPDVQRDFLTAEVDPTLCAGNGALERGDLGEAERLFLQAVEESDKNPFLRAFALGGLCELYSRLQDPKKLEAAFKQYALAIGKLPGGMGGDMMGTLKNTFDMLRSMQETVDVGKVSQALANEPSGPGKNMTIQDLQRGAGEMRRAVPFTLGATGGD